VNDPNFAPVTSVTAIVVVRFVVSSGAVIENVADPAPFATTWNPA